MGGLKEISFARHKCMVGGRPMVNKAVAMYIIYVHKKFVEKYLLKITVTSKLYIEVIAIMLRYSYKPYHVT